MRNNVPGGLLLYPQNFRRKPSQVRSSRVTTKVVEVELASGSGTQRQWNSEVPEFRCAHTPSPGQPGRY